MINFYIVDTETLGLSCGYHEINQISIIRVSDGFQKSINIAVDYPERASQQALDIQKKTKWDLKIGIPKEEAVEEIDAFLEEDGLTPGHRCMVAHNSSFDRRFIHALWDSVAKAFKADLWMCTKQFTQKFAKRVGPEKIMSLQKTASGQSFDKPKFTLEMCMYAVGLNPKFGAHSAIIDTQNTLQLFKNLMDQKLEYVSLIKRQPHHETNISE